MNAQHADQLDVRLEITGIQFHNHEWETELDTAIDMSTCSPITASAVHAILNDTSETDKVECRVSMPFKGVEHLSSVVQGLSLTRSVDENDWEYPTSLRDINTLYVCRASHAETHSAVDVAAFWRPASFFEASVQVYESDAIEEEKLPNPIIGGWGVGGSVVANSADLYRIDVPDLLVFDDEGLSGASREDMVNAEPGANRIFVDVETGRCLTSGEGDEAVLEVDGDLDSQSQSEDGGDLSHDHMMMGNHPF